MADFGVHVARSRRGPLAGWLGRVCTSAFCLQHAVRANYGGKSVLVVAGVWVHYAGSAHPMVRRVALANAVLMAAGQLWYSAFWGSPGAIAAFVAPGRQHGGQPREQHVLHSCGVCPGLILLCAVGYYAAFAALFAAAAAHETPNTPPFGYAVAACTWHVWVGGLLAWSALLQQCKGRRTPLDEAELQKLVGVPASAVTGLPLVREVALAVPPQRPVPAPQTQHGQSLFRFDHIRHTGSPYPL